MHIHMHIHIYKCPAESVYCTVRSTYLYCTYIQRYITYKLYRSVGKRYGVSIYICIVCTCTCSVLYIQIHAYPVTIPNIHIIHTYPYDI